MENKTLKGIIQSLESRLPDNLVDESLERSGMYVALEPALEQRESHLSRLLPRYAQYAGVLI